eukprot:989394-Pyramimonas_sp.AAC.1
METMRLAEAIGTRASTTQQIASPRAVAIGPAILFTGGCPIPKVAVQVYCAISGHGFVDDLLGLLQKHAGQGRSSVPPACPWVTQHAARKQYTPRSIIVRGERA